MTSSRKLISTTIIIFSIGVSNAYATVGDADSLSKADQIKLVRNNGNDITDFTNPDKDVQLAAVQSNIYSFQYIKNPDKDVQLYVVQRMPDYISNYIYKIKNPIEEVQLVAVQRDPNDIRLFENPTNKVQLAAFQKNPGILYLIKNPTEEVQLAAVQKNPNFIGDIKNPTEEVQLYIMEKFPEYGIYIKNPSRKVSYLINGINTRPNGYLITDKTISLAIVNGDQLKITNLTNDFITIASLAEYYGENIYSQDSFAIPPQGVLTKYLRTPDNVNIKSFNDTLLYGFAVQYSLPNNSKQFSLFKTNKYKVSDLIGNK
jgi:hypothetical protein